jgi:MFS family permease
MISREAVSFWLSTQVHLPPGLVGATAAGWMADRMGRKTPLMISILWYSLLPIAKEFDVPLTAVTAVFTITLWMRRS